MSDRIRRLYKAARDLEQSYGRQPTPEEIADELDVEPRKVQWMLKVSWQPLSLENPVGEEEDSELGSFIEDDTTPTPTQIGVPATCCAKSSNRCWARFRRARRASCGCALA